VPYTVDVVLVDKARMNEIKIGNKHVVKVTITHDIPQVQFMLPDEETWPVTRTRLSLSQRHPQGVPT
jgi:hypothetical protein